MTTESVHTAFLSAGVYHTAPFLQVYAYTPYSASCTSCCYATVPHSVGLQAGGSMLHLRAAGMHENHIEPVSVAQRKCCVRVRHDG